MWTLGSGGAASAVYALAETPVPKPALLATSSGLAGLVILHVARQRTPAKRGLWMLLGSTQFVRAAAWTAWAVKVAASGPVPTGSLVYSAFLPAYPVITIVIAGLAISRERGRGCSPRSPSLAWPSSTSAGSS